VQSAIRSGYLNFQGRTRVGKHRTSPIERCSFVFAARSWRSGCPEALARRWTPGCAQGCSIAALSGQCRADAMGQFRTHAAQQTGPLFDCIDSTREERWGNREGEGSRRFDVDGKIVVRGTSRSTTAASVVGSWILSTSAGPFKDFVRLGEC
jgi:hypothetical protein